MSGYVGGHVYEESSGGGYRDEFLKGGFLLHQSINIPKEFVWFIMFYIFKFKF